MSVQRGWQDSGSGPGFGDYVGPAAFKPVVPVPKGKGWPVLKSAYEADHEYEAAGPGADAPCTCGLPKKHPDHK